MECPGCHSLNPDTALSCSLCGIALIRRDDSHTHKAKNEPLIGASYAAAAEDDGSMQRHARRAFRFMVITMIVQGLLGAALYLHESLFAAAGQRLDLQGGGRTLIAACVGLYAWLTLSYSVAKTGESLGMGFWFNFGMALLPPLLPAALARIGHRSILYAYVYLICDAMMATIAWRVFDYAPTLSFFVLVAEIPLVIYHLTGCSAGSIAEGLGLNAYAATIWTCVAPLALVIYLMIDQGVFAQFVTALVSHDDTINSGVFTQLFDPTLVTDDYTVVASICIWALVGWTFWIKSVYESLRYPLI